MAGFAVTLSVAEAAAFFVAAAAFFPGRAVAGDLLRGGGDLLHGAGDRRGGLLGDALGPFGCPLGVALAQLCGQLVGELPEQLVADVGHHAAPELGRPAGDVEVGEHVHAGDRALRRERGRHHGGRRAVAALVLAAGVDDGAVRGLVLLDERRLALVGQVDRPELHLDPPGEVVAVDGVQRRPRHAGCDPLDVEEHPPRLVDGHRDGERVLQLHG